MKNKILFTLLICLGSFITVSAQILPNNGFEAWVTDTNYLVLSLVTPTLYDTSYSPSPVNWTSSNELTNTNTFSHKTLITQSGTSYTGTSSIKLRSDSLYAAIAGSPIGTINLNFICPGFIVCGSFPINFTALTNIVTNGTYFNPALLPGAGIPMSSRLGKIGGYLKYTPVGGDTAYVIAILRQGSTVVATATYTRYTNDAGFSYFEAPFVYQNCLTPDTLVYTLSSGNPYSINNVIGLSPTPTGQHIGSTLLADSLFLGSTIVYGISYPVNDSVHTFINTAVKIAILANDSSCDASPLTLDSVSVPLHGTAVISGDSIIYTPNTGYSGLDSFTYVESVGTGPKARGKSKVNVSGTLGVNDIAEGKTGIYPNPVSSKLYITNSNPSVSGLHIYDMLGKVMKAESISSDATVDVSGLNNGIYIIQFSNTEGKMLSSSRFIVAK